MGIKAFNVADLGKVGLLDPVKMGYKDSLEIIKDESFKIQKSFVKIGWYLKHIRDEELYKADGYENIYDCAAEQLGYAQSTVSRLINICEKFSKDHNSPELDEKYSGFDKSQMIEMLPMSPEQLEKVTPEMTVKQIREVNKETKAVKEPSDKAICDFYWKKIGKLSGDKRKNLKEYMIENYGKSHAGGGPNPNFKCTPRGIKLNASDEITWTSFVKRVNELIPFQEEVEKEDMDIPGQTSIEKDFPEYMPEEHSVSMDQENIIDGKYREVPETTETLKKSEPDIDGSHRIISTKDLLENEDEENLREEIEALADGVREVFWGWEGQPIPKGEVEAAKKNAIKLSIAIEKLLTLL